MSDEIIKVLDSICEKFGLAIDWTSKNALPYVEELLAKYINYEIVTSIALIVLWVLFIILGLYGVKKSTPRISNDDFFLLTLAISIIAVSIGVVGLIVEIEDLITCYTFPEKMIIEELMRLYNA